MPTLNELTETQFKNLLDDYFAPPKKRQKMTQEEILDLAVRLNEKVDVPLIGDTTEEKILVKVVLKVDTFLYDNLPNEVYDLVRSVDKGIDEQEATRLINRLSVLANEKIDIPYIPDSAEYVAIRFVIGVIINAARKQWNFNIAKDASNRDLVLA
jgi:hypothetical protein